MVTLRHESDVDTWGGQDRDYYTFVVTSVLLGLVGGDHIYLRSFKTAFLKALFNLFTLGGWYWWDLSQILFQKETVLKEGLASPFDWIRNIGRGVFVDPANPVQYVSQKSYVIYGICAVFFGLIAADKFYMGQYITGIFKLILCLNIFTFLIGWLWAGWDAWNAVFCEKELLEKGIPPPLGFSSVLPHSDPSVFKLHEKKEGDDGVLQDLGIPFGVPPGPVRPWVHWTLGILGLLPQPKGSCAPRVFSPKESKESKESNNGKESKEVKEVKEEKKEEKEAPIAATAATAVTATNAKTVPTNNVISTAVPEATRQSGGAHPVVSEVADSGGPPDRTDSGGGPGPIIAGALTAVLAVAGLKGTFEFISRQYN